MLTGLIQSARRELSKYSQSNQAFNYLSTDYLISKLLLIRSKNVSNFMRKREVRPQGFEPRTF